jgi:small basic protein
MTPLGLVFGSIFNVQTDNQYMSYLLAAVVGMFLHISTTIIFESSENHKFNFVKLLSIIFGVALAVSIA